MKLKICASGEVMFDYDPYNGHRYRVDCGNYNYRYADSPKLAIQYWFKGSQKNPMDCAIFAKYKDDAVKLCEAATPELLSDMYQRYPISYKLDYLINEAEKQVRNGCRFFLGDGEYGDQIHPFSYG